VNAIGSIETARVRDGQSVQGYAEPSTLKIEQLFANYDLARIPALLQQLERQCVDVIVTHAAATYAVVKGRRTIPVVYEFSADPITLGIAKDLAHPLDNATGITLMSVEMNGKRLELLHEIAAQIRRVAVLANAMSRQLPVVSGWAVMAESGALFTYGPRLVESYRRVAYYAGHLSR
jgi:ABC-type uncharacterized transport system substrate-binding protein